MYRLYSHTCDLLEYYCSDGHHKLVRWKFVTHAGIDGYSRLIVYVKCSTNNRASTVYELFLAAIQQYHLPSRVRSDQGRENVLVVQHMIEHRGAERNSMITGSSVHNQGGGLDGPGSKSPNGPTQDGPNGLGSREGDGLGSHVGGSSDDLGSHGGGAGAPDDLEEDRTPSTPAERSPDLASFLTGGYI